MHQPVVVVEDKTPDDLALHLPLPVPPISSLPHAPLCLFLSLSDTPHLPTLQVDVKMIADLTPSSSKLQSR